MAYLGVSYHDVGRPRFAPKGQYIDRKFYPQVLSSHYSIEFARIFGGAGVADYCFMQDGSSGRTALSIQKECDELFPPFTPTAGWPGSSPDLSVLYFLFWATCRGW